MITSLPFMVELYALHWLFFGTVSVNSNSVRQQDIRKVATDLFEKMLNQQTVFDFENPLLYQMDGSTAYNPNDSFAPILFVEKQPLLLSSKYCATGVHRLTLLQLMHVMQANDRLKVKFENDRLNLFPLDSSNGDLYQKINQKLKEDGKELCLKYIKNGAC